jgi:putative membrane protein
MLMAEMLQRRAASLLGIGSHVTGRLRHREVVMSIFSSIRILIISAPLAAAMGAQAMSPTRADIEFVDRAIIGGLLEIRYAEIAMHRNLTPQELAFAQEVIADHLRLNKELTDLARMKSIAAPDELPADGQERLLAMSKVDDRAFNANFLKLMIDCHKDAVGLFDDEQSTSRDPDLRPLAVTQLPQLKVHLDTAKQLAARY